MKGCAGFCEKTPPRLRLLLRYVPINASQFGQGTVLRREDELQKTETDQIDNNQRIKDRHQSMIFNWSKSSLRLRLLGCGHTPLVEMTRGVGFVENIRLYEAGIIVEEEKYL